MDATGIICVTMKRNIDTTNRSEHTAFKAGGRGFFLILMRPRVDIDGLQMSDTTAARMAYTRTLLRVKRYTLNNN